LQATIPNNSGQMIYRAKKLLAVSGVSVNGSKPGVAVDGFPLVAFLGDTSGDGQFSGNDGGLAGRVAGGQDTGFAAYPLVDPIIVADVAGVGVVDANCRLGSALHSGELPGTATETRVGRRALQRPRRQVSADVGAGSNHAAL
jgi:hypothetical protein